MRHDHERLLDILDAIEQIELYAGRGIQAVEADKLIQIWVVHHLQIIGEAARNISNALRTAHPEIPWAQIIAMRNILVHNYTEIDLGEVWSTVERDLPELKRCILLILSDFEQSSEIN